MATQVRVRRSQASHKKTADILQIAGESVPLMTSLIVCHSILFTLFPASFSPLMPGFRLYGSSAKADTIDIDLDDDPESGAGFAMRFQPKIPPDLLSSLQSSEDTRKKFRSFLEPKINEMITAFFDQQNGERHLFFISFVGIINYWSYLQPFPESLERKIRMRDQHSHPVFTASTSE